MPVSYKRAKLLTRELSQTLYLIICEIKTITIDPKIFSLNKPLKVITTVLDKRWLKGLVTICKLPEVWTPCGMTFCKQPLPVSDNLIIWVVVGSIYSVRLSS